MSITLYYLGELRRLLEKDFAGVIGALEGRFGAKRAGGFVRTLFNFSSGIDGGGPGFLSGFSRALPIDLWQAFVCANEFEVLTAMPRPNDCGGVPSPPKGLHFGPELRRLFF